MTDATCIGQSDKRNNTQRSGLLHVVTQIYISARWHYCSQCIIRRHATAAGHKRTHTWRRAAKCRHPWCT